MIRNWSPRMAAMMPHRFVLEGGNDLKDRANYVVYLLSYPAKILREGGEKVLDVFQVGSALSAHYSCRRRGIR